MTDKANTKATRTNHYTSNKTRKRKTDTLFVHALSIQWMANPRVVEVINQVDNLPNVSQTSLHHTKDPIDAFPTGQKIYGVQAKLT